MYRPKSWSNPLSSKLPFTAEDNKNWRFYEAGANAMLEALKKGGEYQNNKEIVPSSANGWVVFIPDEQVKKDD